MPKIRRIVNSGVALPGYAYLCSTRYGRAKLTSQSDVEHCDAGSETQQTAKSQSRLRKMETTREMQ